MLNHQTIMALPLNETIILTHSNSNDVNSAESKLTTQQKKKGHTFTRTYTENTSLCKAVFEKAVTEDCVDDFIILFLMFVINQRTFIK